jgi:hypothetical protein
VTRRNITEQNRASASVPTTGASPLFEPAANLNGALCETPCVMPYALVALFKAMTTSLRQFARQSRTMINRFSFLIPVLFFMGKTDPHTNHYK